MRKIITLQDIVGFIIETVVASILIIAFVLFTIAVYLAEKGRGLKK